MSSSFGILRPAMEDKVLKGVPSTSTCSRCRDRGQTCHRSRRDRRCVSCARASAFCLYPDSPRSSARSAIRKIHSHLRQATELLSDLESYDAAGTSESASEPLFVAHSIATVDGASHLSTSPVLAPASPRLSLAVTPAIAESSSHSPTCVDTVIPAVDGDDSSSDNIPSVDLSTIDWNNSLDLGRDSGTMFAFNDLYPEGFLVGSPSSSSSDSSVLSSVNSGFLGSGRFLEM